MRFRDLFSFSKNSPREKSVNPTMEGLLPTSWPLGWWQEARTPISIDAASNSTIEACVSALSQTAAMCPLHHMIDKDDEGEARKKGSYVERVLLRPNSYQTRSGFIVDAVRSVYFEGNAYGVVEQNSVGTITAIHLMNPRTTRAFADPETKEVFYYATPRYNQPFSFDAEEDRVFPARKMFHLRLHTSSRDPLKGETPIAAALNSVAANNAITAHQSRFFNNMSRPSGTLSTDESLTKEQMDFLRERWNEQSQDLNSGGVPILSRGLKFQSMSLTSQDSQLVEAYGLTVADISRAFRVPLVLINDMSGATFNNAEQTMSFFLMSGLGFLLDHIELEFAKLFNLPFQESINFDTRVLMRTDFEGRMKGLTEAVLGGVYSPNDARKREKLPSVEGGDEPRVQKQLVPLTAFYREQELAEQIALNSPQQSVTFDTPPDDDAESVDSSSSENDSELLDSEERFFQLMKAEYKRVTEANAAYSS